MTEQLDDWTPVGADIAAEQCTLGAMILSPAAAAVASEIVCRDDFTADHHKVIFEQITDMRQRGVPVDAVTLVGELARRRAFVGNFDHMTVTALVEGTPTASNVAVYAKRVAEIGTRRRLDRDVGMRVRQRLRQPDADLGEILDDLRAMLDVESRLIVAGRDDRPAPVELDDFLGDDDDDDEYDWVAPGLLERHDRVIVTGPEGGGKSTFLRQTAVQVASGIHPFTGDKFDPQRVLYVDLENSAKQSRRALRPLRLAAGGLYESGHFLLQVRPEGLDLTTQPDRDWLMSVALAADPDLIVIGPIYKMANGDPTEEKSAKPVAVTLDQIRVKVGAALLIEAHSPKTMHGTKRAIEPYGWSGWLRWPEFGIHLSPEGQITHWRGGRDRSREWPAALQKGGDWPWSPVTRGRDLLWAQIVGHCRNGQLSYRDLAALTGAHRSSIERAIREHRAEWDALAGDANA